MNKINSISLFTLLFMLLFGVETQAANRVYSDPQECQVRGSIAIPLKMDNTDEIVAAEFNVALPNGLSPVLDGSTWMLKGERLQDHAVVTKKMGSIYKVVVYSIGGKNIRGNKGVFLYMPVALRDGIEIGTKLNITLSDIVITDKDGNNLADNDETVIEVTATDPDTPDITVTDITTSVTNINPEDVFSVNYNIINQGNLVLANGWKEDVSLVASTGEELFLGSFHHQGDLSAGASVERSESFTLPALPGIEGNVSVRVKLTPYADSGEHESRVANNTVVSTATMNVKKKLTLTVPTSIDEQDTGLKKCVLTRSGFTALEENFNLSFSDPSRLSLTGNTTFAPGSNSVTFYVSAIDDNIVNISNNITVRIAAAHGYSAVQGTVTINDDDNSQLTAEASASEVTEGGKFSVTVSSNRPVTTEPLEVKVTCDQSTRLLFPTTITIPAGQNSATMEVEAIDDDVPQLEAVGTLTFTALRHDPTELLIALVDNDMPELEFIIQPKTVSENAGVNAITARLVRKSNTDKEVTINLSDNSGGKIYYSRQSIVLPKGVDVAEFTLGVIDNALVDGDKEVTITAAVLVQSCNCSSTQEGVGLVSQTVTIIDNDGPSLTLTASSSSILEGDNNGVNLTISRNTDTSEALIVNLSSDLDEQLQYEHTATIPAGATSVTVNVKAPLNEETEGNRTVVFSVTSSGFSQGTTWLVITDQTLPDAVITELSLTSTSLIAGESAIATVTVKNIGNAPLPQATKVVIKLDGNQNEEVYTDKILEQGEQTTLTKELQASKTLGRHTYQAVVNEEQKYKELLYTNNTSQSVVMEVTSPYTATVNCDKNVYEIGDSITLTGQVTCAKPAFVDVEVYYYYMGVRNAIKLTTNSSGQFSHKMAFNSPGHFTVGACYPDEGLTATQCEFDVRGFRCSPNYLKLTAYVNELLEGNIQIDNPTSLQLIGLHLVVDNPIEGVEVTGGENVTVSGGATAAIPFSLLSTRVTEGNKYERLKARVTSDQGVEAEVTISFYCTSHTASLEATPSSITTTMIKDGTRDYMLDIRNCGMGETGKISLALPRGGWMKAVTPMEMESLAAGETATIVLRLQPTADMDLNVPVTGHIGVNCSNADGLSIPFRITPVSSANGSLTVDVCDEFTYYTDEHPHLQGAKVTIRDYSTNQVLYEGLTDADGLYHIDAIHEGYYSITVGSDHHDTYSNTILINPEEENRLTVNLSYQAISVNWKVVEDDVEDVYEIVTEVTYETRVPVPVVVLDMPSRIDGESLAPGESMVFYATMTNKGLITAKECQLIMPQNTKVLNFTALVDGLFELAPQQSIVIPVKVQNTYQPGANQRRPEMRMEDIVAGEGAGGGGGTTDNGENDAPGGGGSRAWLDEEGCEVKPVVVYKWDCGFDKKWHSYQQTIQVKRCKSDEVNKESSGGSGPGGGGGDYIGPDGPNDIYWYDPTTNTEGDYVRPNIQSPQPIFENCLIPCINGWLKALGNLAYVAAKYLPVTKWIIGGIEAVKTANKISDSLTEHSKYIIQKTKELVNGDFDASNPLNWCGLAKNLWGMGEDIWDAYDLYDSKTEKIKKAVTNYAMESMQEGHSEVVERDLIYYYIPSLADEDAYLFTKEQYGYETNQRFSSGTSDSPTIRKDGTEVHWYSFAKYMTWDDWYGGLKNGQKWSKKANKYVKMAGKVFDSEWISGLATTASKEIKYLGYAMDGLNVINGFLHVCDRVKGVEGNEKEVAERHSLGDVRKPSLRKADIPLPSYMTDMLEKVEFVKQYYQYKIEFIQLAFGSEPDWTDVSFFDLMQLIDTLESRTYTREELEWWRPECMSETTLRAFVDRYNNRMAGNDMESLEKINDDLKAMVDIQNYFIDLGAEDLNDWLSEAIIDNMVQVINSAAQTVCATISLRFEQQMVLTRQAFLGTLEVYNGNDTDTMTDMKLDIVVTDPDGNVATSHEFQINNESLNNFGVQSDGTWTLGPKQTGTATIRFIPTKYAAPEDTVYYSFGGTLTYVDPYNGQTVKRTLNPVTLAVCPSPDLELTYFMQRDVLGDNTLTPDVVEPSEEAEFSLLLRNIGKGMAKNVRFSTKQPEIIDNEKGLLIDFEIESSQINGEDKTLALGETIVNYLGNIIAGGHSVVQWWLKSSQLGHFTKYDVNYTHLTSYDNPNLSLISSVSIKELIRSVRDDKGDFAFLTNDTPDGDDMADHIYKTDGRDYDVLAAVANEMVDNGDDTYTLTIHPQIAGNWIYGNLTDPTQGQQAIKSVTRISDGKEVEPRNFWQTYVTLRDGKDPLEENLIHFVDSVNSVSESYLITFEDKAETTLDVESIVADQNTEEVLKTPVNTVTVTFNKPVVQEDVNASCITLQCQGKKVDIEDINITIVNETTFAFDVTPYTFKNGYYVFTIQTADIHDTEGFPGKNGRQLTWTQQKDLKKVVLDELSTVPPTAEEEVEVTVKRKLKTGEWNTLCLPFTMNSVQVKSEFGDDVQILDFTGYNVTKDDKNHIVGIDVNFTSVEAIEANHPYLIAVTKPFTSFNAYAVDIEPVEVPKVATITRTNNLWSEFIGTYVAETVVPNNMLFLNANKFYYSTGQTKMKAFRAYFDFSDVLDDLSDADARIRINIDDDITAIKAIDAGKMAEGVYTLQGVFIGKNPDISKLPKGVYIVDGRKVFVK